MHYKLIVTALLAVLLLAGCGSQEGSVTQGPASPPSPALEARAPSVSPSVPPSATPLPSATSTSTAVPSATPSPTSAPPTATSSATPLPPTATLPAPTMPPAKPTSQLDVPDLQAGSAAPTAAPAARKVEDPLQPVQLSIPSLGIEKVPVPVGLDKRRIPIVPKHDVGWYIYSAKPGQGENVVFWGHVLRWKDSPKIPAPFAALKDVQVGARILVQTADGQVHAYRVSRVAWALPDEVAYILPTGREQLTLVSCIGDKVIVDGSVELSHRQITIAVPER